MFHTIFAILGLLLGAVQEPADGQWQLFAPASAGFQILMPAKPQVVEHHVRPLRDREVTVHLASASIQQGKAMFMVAYHDLDFDVIDDEKIHDVLDGGVKGSLFNVLGKLSKHERIEFDHHPGRHFEYAGNRFNQPILADSRIYLVGRRVYQVTVIRRPEVDVSAETEKFVNSFKLVTKEPAADSTPESGRIPTAPADGESPKKDSAPLMAPPGGSR